MSLTLDQQLTELQLRVERVETETRDLREGLASLTQDHAITRESVRIFTDLIEGMREELGATRDGVHQVQLALQRHMTDEARDRRRQFAGSVTATISTLGTLGVLLWNVVITN
ncbi:hypothetical protein MARPU_05785 [Marichromatium purpuratum 984]|uniref:Uncharacterized protein n=1 Tax=Marichromatium purpuratum 984 TaxID=765910 RepID=W0E7C3_MARPU|nr:hypothetical protein [Marichromatium purpuratum]AHF05418.1 hypothetical protein MARPU_05785 [Marichromatium purpuratum 984]